MYTACTSNPCSDVAICPVICCSDFYVVSFRANALDALARKKPLFSVVLIKIVISHLGFLDSRPGLCRATPSTPITRRSCIPPGPSPLLLGHPMGSMGKDTRHAIFAAEWAEGVGKPKSNIKT